ncbi:CCA tRNA nucleotidyltransferase [Ancylobacter sp. MQZ15Z-1]|uniref:CCA tRNA nucleotidyltransferase n=1 Tax=Ancylobacter mangrovi TaxID=2972472 RepID=A0A9X2PBH7_9HYPH|nr:CCA tRNA nucleotidyltransferase [Ancylobacter mangrovi]MCS0493846.1 CCA tRNA nucleotidyltransferase [Ancylobacter mangrovi]
MNPLFAHRPGLARVLAVLDGEGEEARIVGGAVRDWLIGRGVRSDIDIATTALPEEVTRRARAAGLKPVPTGIEHGTVTVIAEGEPYEVTTLREDVETDGRRARVVFGRNWAHDAARRDFTMNALYLTRAGELVDLVGGEADAVEGRVRFIGDADTRIREDYLRILRLFRFHAAFGRGPLDAAALAAAIRNRAGLALLSRERVRAETMKLLVAARAAQTLAEMEQAGLLSAVLGRAGDVPAFSRLVLIEAATGFGPDAVRRLGALAVRGEEDVASLREALRLSNAETARLEALAGPTPAPAMCEKGQKAFIYRLGRQAYLDRALIGFARSGAPLDEEGWRELVTLAADWQAPRFPLKAADLIARGLRPGPALGAALARAEEIWIEAGFPLERAALDDVLAKAVEAAPSLVPPPR